MRELVQDLGAMPILVICALGIIYGIIKAVTRGAQSARVYSHLFALVFAYVMWSGAVLAGAPTADISIKTVIAYIVGYYGMRLIFFLRYLMFVYPLERWRRSAKSNAAPAAEPASGSGKA